MRFIIENSDIDFGYSSIDNIFIEDYMPVAPGSYVKVYLYAYKNMAHSKVYIDNEVLSKNLKMTIADVEQAWAYWEREGVVEKMYTLDGGYDIKFLNLKKLYVENQMTLENQNKPQSREETLVSMMTSSVPVREMFSQIDYYMRRQTTPVEKTEILSWISNYNMSTDMITAAFEYCTEKKQKVSVNYVRAVVISWYDKNYTSLEEVMEALGQVDKKYIRKNRVLQRMGLQFRPVSEIEINTINSWYDEMNMQEELIDAAIDRTANIEKPSINYVNAILQRWKELGIENPEDIEKLDRRKTRKVSVKKTSFHNFKGESSKYTEDELTEIARKKTMRRKRT